MALKCVVGLFSKITVQLSIRNELNSLLGPLAGCVQLRENRKRRRTYPFRWWTTRKRKYYDEYLTKDSKDFIQEVIKHKYLQPNESPLKEPPWERGEWAPDSVRTGVIARKIGIYPMWTKTGRRILTTLLQVVDNHIIKYHTPELHSTMRFGKENSKDGKLGCIVIGAEGTDPQKFTAQYNGLFNEAGVMPKKKLTRFFITPNAVLQPGTPLYATHFRVGDYVDVFGKTVGHGFQGVMKRWGFKGGPKAHGVTKTHRRPGCIGGGIWRINTKHNVIWVHGPAIPGSTHAYVYIFDSCLPKYRHTEDDHPPFPTHFPDEDKEPLPEEFYDKELHSFSDPTITFPEENKA